MEAIEQGGSANLMARAVAEGSARALGAERGHGRLVGDPAQRDDRLEPRHAGDGGGQELATGRDLERKRLVLRRYTAHGVGYRRRQNGLRLAARGHDRHGQRHRQNEDEAAEKPDHRHTTLGLGAANCGGPP